MPNKSIRLALEGGGAKGIVFPSAIRALEELGCQITEVAGTSAGAITAALLAAGYTAEELEELVDPRSPKQVPWDSFRDWGVLGWLTAGLGLAARLHFRGGIYLGKRLERWVCQALATKLGTTDEVRFRDLPIHLYVCAYDVHNNLLIVFSKHTTPGFPVGRAVRASASIPYFFRFVTCEFDYPHKKSYKSMLVDGGLRTNFPLSVFTGRIDDAFGLLLDEATEPLPWWFTLAPTFYYTRRMLDGMRTWHDRELIRTYREHVIRLPVGSLSTYNFSPTVGDYKHYSNLAYEAVKRHEGLKKFLEQT